MIDIRHIVVIIYIIPMVGSLFCYDCKADSEQRCHASETREQCHDFQDMCIHIRYSYHVALGNGSKIVKHKYNKRCIISVHGECSLYCKDVSRRDAFNCKVKVLFWGVRKGVCRNGQRTNRSKTSLTLGGKIPQKNPGINSPNPEKKNHQILEKKFLNPEENPKIPQKSKDATKIFDITCLLIGILQAHF